MLSFKSKEIIMWKDLCFQDSKVSNLVLKLSQKPSNILKLNSSLNPQNFQESSFEGLSFDRYCNWWSFLKLPKHQLQTMSNPLDHTSTCMSNRSQSFILWALWHHSLGAAWNKATVFSSPWTASELVGSDSSCRTDRQQWNWRKTPSCWSREAVIDRWAKQNERGAWEMERAVSSGAWRRGAHQRWQVWCTVSLSCCFILKIKRCLIHSFTHSLPRSFKCYCYMMIIIISFGCEWRSIFHLNILSNLSSLFQKNASR